ncbi:DNA-binding transcriptional LysR family regulator [Robbsia andropogonis]|uniref:LysR family transcriptional regulator n=1 Tax=Robbsia andropogonis TaxID=28092 RepID=UPI003D1BF728
MSTSESRELVRKLSTRLRMRHLLLLLQIREHGSVTRAAEQMATGQPALTNALAEIEALFGEPLFARSPRGMRPTALGDIVLERAQAILHDLDRMALDVGALAAGAAAQLRVGVIPFVSSQLLTQAVRGMLSEMDRRITVTVDEGNSDALIARLRDRSLDLIVARARPLRAAPSGGTDDLRYLPLYQQQPRLIANRRLAARLGRRTLDWHALSELEWVMGASGTPVRDEVARLFTAAGAPVPEPIIETYASKLIGDAIADGERTVALVPADIAQELVRTAGVAIVPWSLTWALPPIGVWTRADNTRATRGIDASFIAALRAAVRADANAMAVGLPV